LPGGTIKTRTTARWSLLILLSVLFQAAVAGARPPIRSEFFTQYPNAVGTQLDQLPSDSKHCGVCHFDFSGGGPRNPYGLAIEVGINNGLSNADAILAIEANDSDADGKSNLVEITDTISFTNTPTFPGLSAGNVGSVSQIPLSEIQDYLTPMGATDSIPPVVTMIAPVGGEMWNAGTSSLVEWTATDNNAVASIDIDMSDDGGSTWKPIGRNLTNTGSWMWFVPNLPGGTTRVRVIATDGSDNQGSDMSPSDFTVLAQTGRAPTTLRDMEMPGTQPFEGAILESPTTCYTCHGDYDPDNEPVALWKGSMMGQAMRDPLFQACLAVAEQDAPSVGDLCLRCHTPGGWQEGRSVDTSGGLLTEKDFHAIHCDFCHRAVDPFYVDGVSPVEDLDVLNALAEIPLQNANAQFISDPDPVRRGPYADAQASHQFLESPYHRSSDMCGTCHDVSNPVFVQTAPGQYAPAGFDAPHPDMDLRNMFPVERTYSEWTQTEYASTGVYAPQFAGNKADGIVSSCQDCHMADASARGSNVPGSPNREDMPRHDFTGGNTFIGDILPDFYPEDVEVTALQAAKARATTMLQLAATLSVTPEEYGIMVRVTNETGHKLPSGYPEGRRIWLNVKGYDDQGAQVFESGAYDAETAELSHDDQVKIYQIKPGLTAGLAGALSLPAGPSFHFVLNDTVYSDNRVPPRGFTNAAFELIQSPPVAHTYADGQYWDDTEYTLPSSTDSVVVSLYYQTISKEYVEFLRDANMSNSAGQDFYDAWAAHGKSTPVLMAQVSTGVDVIPSSAEDPTGRHAFGLQTASAVGGLGPVEMTVDVPEAAHTTVRVFDVRGRQVAVPFQGTLPQGTHQVLWDRRDSHGRDVAAGIYFVRLQWQQRVDTRKVVLVR
jgi:hypothetical protein